MPSSRVQSETKTFASDHDRGLNGVSRLGSDTNNRRNSAIFNNNNHTNHNGTKGHPSSTLDHSPKMDDGRAKNEDVFLNIARSDSSRRDSLGRADFRRSRLGYPPTSLRSPATHAEPEQQTPSLDQRFSNPENPLLAQKGSPTIPGGSHNYAISASTSVHPLDDPTRFRYPNLNSGSRSVIGAPRSRLSRASPETSPRSPPTRGERRSSIHEPRPRRSTLSTSRNGRVPSSSDPIERGPETTEKARDGTESTLSTNAPSTVWDELDDLKSRIRKLELTGKLPPSSQEAISGASQERPRTAATTVTVMSSSPRQQRKVRSPSAEKEAAVQNPVHPLLQTAMTKAQEVLAPEVYSALEATIKDALALSTMLGVNAAPSGTVSVVNGAFASPERVARRKADSVCRSLTELCLALTDKQLRRDRSASASRVLESHSLRANSGETESLAGSSAYQRITPPEAGALERQPSTSSRITSRLEARRLSLINTGVPATGDSRVAQSPSVAPPPSRLHRLSASIRSRRLAQDDELDTTSPLSRSLSRAATETETSSLGQSTSTQPRLSLGRSINRSMPNAMQQGQREQVVDLSPRTLQYQHQGSASVSSPQSQPQTPTPSSNIPYRRSYIATPAQSPAISRSNIQAGSRRYGFSSDLPDSTAGSVVEGRTRFNAADVPRNRTSIPPAKSAVGYTPVSQPRLRTNSLDTRRFGLRRRSAATPDDSFNMDDSID